MKTYKTLISITFLTIILISNVNCQIKVHSDGRASVRSLSYPSRGVLDIWDIEMEHGGLGLYNGNGYSARLFRKNGYIYLTSGKRPYINPPYGITINQTTGNVGVKRIYSGEVYSFLVYGKTYCSYGVWSGSDERLKSNINPISGALEKVQQLKGKTFKYKDDNLKSSSEDIYYGLIAQEVQKVLPELVNELDDSSKYLAINYDGFIPILIEAIKEQQKQIEELNSKIAVLESITLNIDNNTIDKSMSNFPNPFNLETTINLTVPDNTKQASINIYDSRGSLVKKIKIKDRGNTIITFNAEDLSAGIYSYTLEADNKVITSNRMIIQK